MLGWHQVWMSSHGAELAKATRELGHQVRVGVKPLSALAGITAIAVLREGSETVLFLYGILVQGASDPQSMALGGVLGFLSAAALGWLLYAGLVRFSIGYVFGITGIIITLLAAGLAAQAASFLVQSGWLPPLGYAVWDTSWLLSEKSPLGLLLHILVGYISQPLGVQVIAYLATLAAIVSASAWARRAHANRKAAV
jgi:high-affinity iron transporter